MAWQTFSVKGQMRSRFSFSELSCRRPSARRPRGGPPPARPGPRGAPCTAAGGGHQRAGPWLGLGRLEKHPRTSPWSISVRLASAPLLIVTREGACDRFTPWHRDLNEAHPALPWGPERQQPHSRAGQ